MASRATRLNPDPLAGFGFINVSPAYILLVLSALLIQAAVVVWLGPLVGMIIPFVGVVLNLWFVVHKIGRTGAFSTWGLAKHESTPFERRLQITGLSLLAGSILLLWSLGEISRAS
jgi:hypothetical protein